MAYIVLYKDEYDDNIWRDYCNACMEDPDAISLTIKFDAYRDVEAEYEDEYNDEKGDYEICVKGKVTYTINEAESEEDAIQQAIDYFCDDDLFYGTEDAENVTEDDCEVVGFERED